jgi:tetratricopeptide (TPR) repeat protein
MLRLQSPFLALAVAIGLYPIFPTSPATAASPDEAIAKCDTLASDPHDPGRFAPGVTDEQFAPGTAIAACKGAVDANPNLARAWFELGRSYRIAERDADAWESFVQAAKRGYAPAMKYIGDVYKDGRGLPAGEQQSPELAMDWYKKAKEAGLKEADKAIAELSTIIEGLTFKPSIFQNQEYINRLYTSNFDAIDDPIAFFAYTKSFTEKIGGTDVFFINQSCKGMVTQLGTDINSFGGMIGYVQALFGENPVVDIFMAGIRSHFTQDQGERDAVILMDKYKCDTPVTKKIIENVSGSYQKFPAIIKAFGNSKAQMLKRTNVLKVSAESSCNKTISRPGFCACAINKLSTADLTDVEWAALGTSIHKLGVIEKDHPQIVPAIRACYKTPT